MFSDELSGQTTSSYVCGGRRYELKLSELLAGTVCRETGLQITAETLADGDSASWTLHVKNIAPSDSGQITSLLGMDVAFPCSANDRCVWHGLRGGSNDEQSFMPLCRELPVGERFTLEPEGGRPSNISAFPFFDFCVGDTCYAAAIGWSGQWFCELERTESGLILRAGQRDCNYYLLPGESVRSVKVLLYRGSGNAEQTRRGFRALLRSRYSPRATLEKGYMPPVTVQVFDRYFGKNPDFATEKTQLALIEKAAACGGINTFWFDAAWFRDGFPTGVGNYTYAPGFAENGLKKLSQSAHAHGMRFMLWFEPGRADIGSDLYAAHGEADGWLLSHAESGRNCLVNFGNPDTLRWMTDKIISLIRENSIDIYREDYNIDPLAYWRAADVPDRVGMTEMRFVEGFYRFWDTLLEQFPHLLIDNCASGGRRLDLETVSRSISCWRSDTACSPDTPARPVSMWHQNQNVSLLRYLPHQSTSSWREDAYSFRSGVTDGIACQFDLLSQDYDFPAARRALAELAELQAFRGGDFHEITSPEISEKIWFAYQIVKGNRGFAYVFRRKECPLDKYLFKPELPDPAAEYEITVTDEEYTDRTFVLPAGQAEKGILLQSSAPGSSFLIRYGIK